MHLIIWLKQPKAWGSLLFSAAALGTASMAASELWIMYSQTTEQMTIAIRWMHVPVAVTLVSLVGFVRVYLRAGRPWLAWTAVGTRVLVLAINFIVTPNANYREIKPLQKFPFLGELVTIPHGVPGPWLWVVEVSLLALLIFVVDATVALWRRGDRQHALFLGGTIIAFVLLGSAHSAFVFWRGAPIPVMPSLFFMGIIVAMGYELSRDVLRTAQLARELRESEERMSLASQAANLGFWFRDLARNEIWANESWRKLLGFSEAEPLQFDAFLQRLHPDDRDDVRQTQENALKLGRYEKEYRVVLPDGEIRWVASVAGINLGPDGKPLRVHGVSMDITVRKQMEAEVLLQRAELAHLSRVTMLGELSGSLAHELNQPLAAILSNAQAALRFLAEGSGDLDEIRNILRDIVEDDKRAGEVIKRLRTLLKKDDAQHRALDVNEMVSDVWRLMRSDLVYRNVVVSTAFAADLPQVSGDRVQLQQVMVNLLTNACDAMDRAEGDRRLTLQTIRIDGSGVKVSVIDRGRGIPPEDLERIFQPFVSTKTEGMGLGLAVCRTIIASHKGRLWATNNPDCGAACTSLACEHGESTLSQAAPAVYLVDDDARSSER
jgi:PAS domain S-box-containing protein